MVGLINNLKYQVLFQYVLPASMFWFLCILLSRNHIKTHSSLLYLFLVLIDWNSLFYNSLFYNRLNSLFYNICAFWFLWLINLLKKILLYDSLVWSLNDSFLLRLLQVWYLYAFSHFPWFSQKLYCLSTWKKVLQNYFLHFLLDLCFNQVFWLNLMTLCTFFNTNSSFSACFKFNKRITYSFLSCKFATSFSTFSIFILSKKNGKLLWRLCIFSGYWTSTSGKFTLSHLQYSFLSNLY